MKNIDELLSLQDFSNLSDDELLDLERQATKEADAICYKLGIIYNIRDVELTIRLDEQIKYIDIAMTLAFKMGVNFVDTLGTVNAWDTYIYRELLKKNIVVPPSRNAKKEKYDGGYVKEPQLGMFDWIVSFDLASLYPNIIAGFNTSPETIVENKREPIRNVESILSNEQKNSNANEYSMTANGVYFRKDIHGILPELVEGLYSERKIVKSTMISLKTQREHEYDPEKQKQLDTQIAIADNQQMAAKIAMNSLYGCLGTPYFRLFDIRIAEGITQTGQLIIRWAEKAINEYLNKILDTKDQDYVIAIDTDSLYVNFSPLVEKLNPNNPIDFLDKIAKEKFNPFFEKLYSEFGEMMGCYSQRMDMKREKICKGFWTGKKRYVLRVYDNEGVRYETPKISITGIEAVKSSTPAIIRGKLKDVFKIILENDQDKVKAYIDETRKDFMSRPPEEIASPRGVSELNKYSDTSTIYSKGTPIHSRAALLFNHLVKQHNIGNKYYTINGGDKILWVYLKVPNPIHENVIGFVDVLPKEFDLHNYIDYNTQFEKTYLNVMTPIFDSIGWDNLASDSSDLDAFF